MQEACLKVSHSNIKSTIDSIVMSAIMDFCSKILDRMLEGSPDISEKDRIEISVMLTMDMANFFSTYDIGVDSEYFKHWYKIFSEETN